MKQKRRLGTFRCFLGRETSIFEKIWIHVKHTLEACKWNFVSDIRWLGSFFMCYLNVGFSM